MAKKKLSKRLINTKLAHVLLSGLASVLVRLIYATCRVEKRFAPEALPYLRSEHPAIFCFWHGRMIMHPFMKPRGRTIQVLVSHHNDGALITATMRWFGIGSVRGSRKLGGAQAVRELMAITERGGNIAITPDGPRGPFQQCAPGAAFVACKTGYPLVPTSFSATRYWRFRSWDRFMLPKPFGRIVFVAHAPIIARGEDAAAQAETTATLETSLAEATAEADADCGVV